MLACYFLPTRPLVWILWDNLYDCMKIATYNVNSIRQRLPIVHVKLEGLSVAETASLTGMSESAIKVGVHRGLKALAAKIRKDE